SLRRFALRSRRALRIDAACALPRPSAMASAKLAKSTVNQSHTETQKMNQAGASPLPTSAWTQSRLVRIDPTYTTNITGLRTCRQKVSLRKESTIACLTIRVSKKERVRAAALAMGQLLLHRDQGEVLDDGPEGQRGHEREGADQNHHPDQQGDEQGRVGREGPRPRRHGLLPGQRARDG